MSHSDGMYIGIQIFGIFEAENFEKRYLKIFFFCKLVKNDIIYMIGIGILTIGALVVKKWFAKTKEFSIITLAVFAMGVSRKNFDYI